MTDKADGKTEAKELKNRIYVKLSVDLEKAFASFGKVENPVIIGHRGGQYAFLTFETEEQAAKAIAAMNGKTLTTDALTVEYSTSKPKGRRRGPGGGRGGPRRGPKRESGGDGKPADKPAGEKPKGEATPAKPKAEAGNKQASGKKESAKKAA